MRTARRAALGVLLTLALGLASSAVAQAAGPYELVLDQGAAFAILGHSCGGIQEESFAAGFAPSGYPQGEVALSTSCGGSGRGGGYKPTRYTASASVVWDWFGETVSYVKLEAAAGGSPDFEATDAFGDRIYESGTHAYLQTGEPPLRPPAPPGGVEAALVSTETGEESEPVLSFAVSWVPDHEAGARISSSTITATPLGGSSAPVLTTSVSGSAASGSLGPLAPHTSYSITVTSSDDEGTSEASAPIEMSSAGSPPPPPPPSAFELCTGDEGTIKLAPGLSETPHVQALTVKGRLSGCEGRAAVESAGYVDHLVTREALSCSALASLSAEPETAEVSLALRWAPSAVGVSHGTLIFPLTEAGSVRLSGTLEAGPFAAPEPILGGTVTESFTGGPTCGLAEGKKKPKAVKTGVFSGSELEIGEATSE